MSQTTTTSPYLTGNFAPVTEEVTAFDLPVTGTIPAELDGRYLRNGPNPIGSPDPATYHWFTGHGMVHGVSLRGGKAEWYRNRWVRTPDVTEALGEDPKPNPFGPDVRVFSANTSIIGHAGKTFAIVEAGAPPVELTDELDTIGPSDLDGTLEHPFSAHPKLDPDTGELHVSTYYWAWGNNVRYLVVDRQGRVRHQADIEMGGGTMMHDIGMSQTRVALFDFACVFNIDLAMSGAAFPYRWTDDYHPRIAVLPKGGTADQVTWFDAPGGYVFHPLNCFDRSDGAMVLDVIKHPSMFRVDHNGPNDGSPALVRWVLDPATGRSSEEVLDDHPAELPRINETLTGRQHRYGYAIHFATDVEHGPTLKYDVDGGATEVLDHGPGRFSLEPVFVPRDGATAEDDGWLVQVVYDAGRDGSDLVVTHAQDLGAGPVATVTLPQRVPFGFHGNWVPRG